MYQRKTVITCRPRLILRRVKIQYFNTLNFSTKQLSRTNMSFFKLSTGETAAASTTFEMGGGDIEPIPKNTNVLAAVEEAKISEYQGEQTINLKWRVLKPEAYAKRVIFQKIKCWDTDKEKADKAVQMLAAIDANCGGKLMKSGAE